MSAVDRTHVPNALVQITQQNPAEIKLPVFTIDQGTKTSGPGGLTWQGGICNATTKFVIVSDVGQRFIALPNAAFHLARLLGAPTNCTRDYSVLEGNYILFNLSSCVMDGIRNHLQKLQKDNVTLARDCFGTRYRENISHNFPDLPYNLVENEEKFCSKEKRLKEPFTIKGRCENPDIKYFSEQGHERRLTEKGLKVLDPVNSCFFECCAVTYILELATDYRLERYAAFDGTPCGENRKNICVQAKCVQNTAIP
ncbi:uncharacterized protein LOC135399708 [Ornithodoros turicata]|uniref:uncharacterized protein LOC135399708 n=1 Tax=Ornithodoros turicata TaxID=34597 RepID=UPI00313A4D6B